MNNRIKEEHLNDLVKKELERMKGKNEEELFWDKIRRKYPKAFEYFISRLYNNEHPTEEDFVFYFFKKREIKLKNFYMEVENDVEYYGFEISHPSYTDNNNNSVTSVNAFGFNSRRECYSYAGESLFNILDKLIENDKF